MPDKLSHSAKPLKLNPSTYGTFHIKQVIPELRKEKSYTRSGKAARSLVHSANLTTTVIILKKDAGLKEHSAPGPGVVTVIEGEIKFEINQQGISLNLKENESVAFSADLPHSVYALKDSAFSLFIGGRQ